ncbi:MAG: hypothetical protein AABW84_00210 [Nanoarchaeota archaeon]
MALPNIGIDWHKDDKQEEKKENNQENLQSQTPEKKSLLPKFEFKIADKPREAIRLKERKEKTTNKTKQIIVWFTVLILVGSTIGFFGISYLTGAATGLPNNAFRVGDYVFYSLEDSTFGTLIKHGGKDIPILFRLDPRYAEGIPLEQPAIQRILGSQKIYLVLDPNAEEIAKYVVAATEIARITALYGIETITAYTRDSNPVQQNIPIKDCDAVDATTGVIRFQLGTTGITVENGCVLIAGDTPDELILAADKLGYNLVGIAI